MGFMIRKIDWAKWKAYDISNGIGIISADLITKDLKTSSNALSLWFADSEDRVEDVVLALVSNYKIINIIDIIKIDRRAIEGKGLPLRQEDGNTFYLAYKSNHYNLTNLTYESLGCFIELILENKTNVTRIKVKDIKSILRNGIDNKKIIKENLDPHILKSLNSQDYKERWDGV
jgi:hypothetical protein